NFTDAGIRQRIEMSTLFTNEPQVKELAKWFDATWDKGRKLDKDQMQQLIDFANNLPDKAVVEDSPPDVSPPIKSKPAALVPRPSSKPSHNSASSGDEVYFNYDHSSGFREWEDARQYGFVCAGGGSWYSSQLQNLHPGDRIWVYAPKRGYVGVGRVDGPP